MSSNPRHLSPQLLGVLPADVSKLSPSQKTGWRELLAQDARAYKGLAPAGTTLKGHPNSGVPCGNRWHPCSNCITAQLILLPNSACFTPSLVVFPRALSSKPPTDKSPSQSLFCGDLNPATVFPSLESWWPDAPFLSHLYSLKSSWQKNSGWVSWTPCFARFLILIGHQSLSLSTSEDCEGEKRWPFPGQPFSPVWGKNIFRFFPYIKGNLCCSDQLDLWFCGILLGNYDMVYLLSICLCS